MEKFTINDKQIKIVELMQQCSFLEVIDSLARYFHLHILSNIKDLDNPTLQEKQQANYMLLILYKLSFLLEGEVEPSDYEKLQIIKDDWKEAIDELREVYSFN